MYDHQKTSEFIELKTGIYQRDNIKWQLPAIADDNFQASLKLQRSKSIIKSPEISVLSLKHSNSGKKYILQ